MVECIAPRLGGPEVYTEVFDDLLLTDVFVEVLRPEGRVVGAGGIGGTRQGGLPGAGQPGWASRPWRSACGRACACSP